MSRRFVLLVIASFLFFAFVAVPVVLGKPASVTVQSTPTFDSSRLAQPPTAYPPAQADNGQQAYWGMCMSCHGDEGQGLTDAWRGSFPEKEQNCWNSGCHGSDYPKNSFKIPETGAPALAGMGALSRFSTAFELNDYIYKNMPLSPTGSLTSESSWELTAYLLQLNSRRPEGFSLNEINSPAISIHRTVQPAESAIPGALLLVGVLILAAIGVGLQRGDSQNKPNFFHHLHPPSIPAEQSRFQYTLGAGGLAVFFSLILLITGLLEMFYYIPTTEDASASISAFITLVPFGSLIRNLHYWSAQFLVITMTIHLLRVALTGAYAPPRRFNYLLGLSLFVLILLLDFTGYVLRWDEGIHWALVVGANLLKTIPGAGLYEFIVGGSEPGEATLTRFYMGHIFGLTFGAAVLMVWHLFRVRRDGGIAAPPPSERGERIRITRFELLRREVFAMTVAGAILLFFSAFVQAPIAPALRLSVSQSITKSVTAPWFFLWVQQLLKWGDPFLLGVLTPVLIVVVLGIIPYILPNAQNAELGKWFPRGSRIAQAFTALILLVIFILTFLGAMS